MRVGLLTGGGDCPGLNAVIRAVVRKGIEVHGWETVGFRNGWQGPIEGLLKPIGLDGVEDILTRGGTILGSSRTNPYKVDGGVDKIKKVARREADAYRAGEERPLGSYLGTMGVYGSTVAALVGIGAATGRRLPDRVAPYDVALLGIATHKLSRLIAKDTVTAPLRAPFTRFEGPQGQAELHEEVRGHGVGAELSRQTGSLRGAVPRWDFQ